MIPNIHDIIEWLDLMAKSTYPDNIRAHARNARDEAIEIREALEDLSCETDASEPDDPLPIGDSDVPEWIRYPTRPR